MKKSAFRYLFVTVAGLTAALLPINILAAPGDLFETDQGSSTIFKFTAAGAKSTFASGLSHPSGLAFDQPPNLVEARVRNDTSSRWTPNHDKNTFACARN